MLGHPTLRGLESRLAFGCLEIGFCFLNLLILIFCYLPIFTFIAKLISFFNDVLVFVMTMYSSNKVFLLLDVFNISYAIYVLYVCVNAEAEYLWLSLDCFLFSWKSHCGFVVNLLIQVQLHWMRRTYIWEVSDYATSHLNNSNTYIEIPN